jgi:hypothetical protein
LCLRGERGGEDLVCGDVEKGSRDEDGGDGWEVVRGGKRGGERPGRGLDKADLMWPELETVDYGSALSKYGNRCLRAGILGSVSEKSGAWVKDLRASFVKSCSNDARTGFFGSDAEVENLRETCSALRKYRVGVWIVFARSCDTLRRGFSVGKLHIGSWRRKVSQLRAKTIHTPTRYFLSAEHVSRKFSTSASLPKKPVRASLLQLFTNDARRSFTHAPLFSDTLPRIPARKHRFPYLLSAEP